MSGEHYRTTRRKSIVARSLEQGKGGLGHYWLFRLECGHHVTRPSTPATDKQKWATCWNCPPREADGGAVKPRVTGGVE
jgi:hypothetical protein